MPGKDGGTLKETEKFSCRYKLLTEQKGYIVNHTWYLNIFLQFLKIWYC